MSELREMAVTTSATRHSANQILLRTKYMIFKETVIPSSRTASDYCFEIDVVKIAKQVVLTQKVHSGAQPRADIFDRPVLRDADKNSAMESFPSALYAVQELSFGSTRVRHVNDIDDILIANNIANNADGNVSESYGYVWFWDDEDMKAREVAKEEEAAAAPTGRSMMAIAMGLPTLCGCDTTT